MNVRVGRETVYGQFGSWIITFKTDYRRRAGVQEEKDGLHELSTPTQTRPEAIWIYVAVKAKTLVFIQREIIWWNSAQISPLLTRLLRLMDIGILTGR